MIVEYAQRTDGEGFDVPSGEIYLMACCDCGLVHDFVFVSEDGKHIGIAARRNESETVKRRAVMAAVGAAGQEAANAKDAWINVKDRLPEPWRGRLFSESVLVVDMDSRYPHVRMTELNFEEYEGKIVPTVWSGADPTHWRPAPALPAAMAAAPSSEKGGA